MEKLNQRDPRWAKIPLGYTTNTSIGSHGCTITCLAMLAGVTPDYVNERLKKVGGYANGNLVIWTKIPQALPNLIFVRRVKGYNNADVLANLPCLVEVDFDGSGTTNDMHWVLFIGNKRMNDPWTGREESTGKYPVRGYSVIKKKDSGIIISEVNTSESTPTNSVAPDVAVTTEPTTPPIPITETGTPSSTIEVTVGENTSEVVSSPNDIVVDNSGSGGDNTGSVPSVDIPIDWNTPPVEPQADQEVPQTRVPLNAVESAIASFFAWILRLINRGR